MYFNSSHTYAAQHALNPSDYPFIVSGTLMDCRYMWSPQSRYDWDQDLHWFTLDHLTDGHADLEALIESALGSLKAPNSYELEPIQKVFVQEPGNNRYENKVLYFESLYPPFLNKIEGAADIGQDLTYNEVTISGHLESTELGCVFARCDSLTAERYTRKERWLAENYGPMEPGIPVEYDF